MPKHLKKNKRDEMSAVNLELSHIYNFSCILSDSHLTPKFLAPYFSRYLNLLIPAIPVTPLSKSKNKTSSPARRVGRKERSIKNYPYQNPTALY